jgi:pimeloyl-ACP methyl ester carboxylesterase
MSPNATPSGATAGHRTVTRENGATIAYHRREGKGPGIVFLGGFMSDMTGSKAMALDAFCRERGRAFLRFDYFAHGASSGDFAEATIGGWAEDALFMLDRLTEGPQILVGSSMGGWIMLLAARARRERIRAMIGIAAAPDFTEDLMWPRFTPAQRAAILAEGRIRIPSAYDPTGYLVTRRLIEEGRRRLVLREAIALPCPVRLLHGMRDADVPWQTSLHLAERLASTDVTVTLAPEGDHRLSTEADLARLQATLAALLDERRPHGVCGRGTDQS